jgi:hypothetical protein
MRKLCVCVYVYVYVFVSAPDSSTKACMQGGLGPCIEPPSMDVTGVGRVLCMRKLCVCLCICVYMHRCECHLGAMHRTT